jgi:hypothetical protein
MGRLGGAYTPAEKPSHWRAYSINQDASCCAGPMGWLLCTNPTHQFRSSCHGPSAGLIKRASGPWAFCTSLGGGEVGGLTLFGWAFR